jgi:hypothetical protein
MTRGSRNSMRAWAIEAYGEPMRCLELPGSSPRPHDLLLRMHTAQTPRSRRPSTSVLFASGLPYDPEGPRRTSFNNVVSAYFFNLR